MHGFGDGEGERESENRPQGNPSSSGLSATRCGEQIKKKLYVLKERGRDINCIGINEKAYGEGDEYGKISYSDPPTHTEECDVWSFGENPVMTLGRPARLMSLSLLVLYMLTVAQEVQTTLL